jgi:hypothetical protein
MHLRSAALVRMNRNEAKAPRDAIGIRRLELAMQWAVAVGLFAVLCLRHAVACAL